MTKQTYSTCAPAGTMDFTGDPKNLALAQADGTILEGPIGRWCNAHIGVLGGSACRGTEIVVDTEHPMYGTPATLTYPDDRYPLVVVGGSKSGHQLVVAPVNTDGFETLAGSSNGFPVHDRTFTTAELLSAMQPHRAFRIGRRRDGTYTQYVRVGRARLFRNYAH